MSIARASCPDGRKWTAELERVIPWHALRNVFCRGLPSKLPYADDQDFAAGVYHGRVIDELLASLFN